MRFFYAFVGVGCALLLSAIFMVCMRMRGKHYCDDNCLICGPVYAYPTVELQDGVIRITGPAIKVSAIRFRLNAARQLLYRIIQFRL